MTSAALQAHYRNLEALALDRDTPEETVDLTGADILYMMDCKMTYRVLTLIFIVEPDAEMIEKRAGKILKEFVDLVYPAGYDPEAKPTKKRVDINLHVRCTFFL